MRSRFWRSMGQPRRLTPIEQQRLDGWVRLLDDPVRLGEAQTMLRLPVHRLPLPPVELPAVVDAAGTVLAPAVEAPAPEEAAAPVAPPVKVGLRGAYARRASRNQGKG